MTRNDPDFEHANSIQINITGVPGTKAGDFRTVVERQFRRGVDPDPGERNRLPHDHEAQRGAARAAGYAYADHQHHRKEDQRPGARGIKRAAARANRRFWSRCPAWTIPRAIKQILQTAAILELYEVQGGPFASREEAMQSKNGILPLSSQILGSGARGGTAREFYILARTPVVTGRDLRDAKPSRTARAAAGRPISC